MSFAQGKVPWIQAAGLLASFCFLVFVSAQEPPPRNVPSPTLRVTTRLVIVDVVVTDKNGQHLKDLTARDFTLLENGKPQRIAAFSLEQTGLAGNGGRPRPVPLPAHVYTNRPEYQMPPAIPTVLLIDALNTSMQDQAFARLQLLRYLGTQLKPDRPISVIALGQSLRVLQDFTDDPDLLRTAVENFRPEQSRQLALGNVEGQAPPPARAIAESRALTASVERATRNLFQFYNEQASVALNVRVAQTLAAFQLVARTVAGFPGRKNLVWVTAGFPLVRTRVVPKFSASADQPNLGMNMETVDRSYEDDLQRTASLLTDAQVAVYAVDARGLVGSTLSDASKPGTDALGSLITGAEFGTQVAKNTSQVRETQATMDELAQQTGGLVFTSRNDIDHAVALSMSDTSSYYVLGYYPESSKWDGKFRKIQANVDQPGVEVRHRRGYYAVGPGQSEKNGKEKEAELMLAMSPSSPPATMVVFDARVIPPGPSGHMQVPVEFLVNPRTLSYDEEKGGSRGYDVEFHVAAFAPDGKVVAHRDEGVSPTLKAKDCERIDQQGFPYRLELGLSPGRYQLRLAVRDGRTGFLGTTDVSLILEGSATGQK